MVGGECGITEAKRNGPRKMDGSTLSKAAHKQSRMKTKNSPLLKQWSLATCRKQFW